MTAKIISMDEKARLVDEIRQRVERLIRISMTSDDRELFRAAGEALVPLNAYTIFGTLRPSTEQIRTTLAGQIMSAHKSTSNSGIEDDRE